MDITEIKNYKGKSTYQIVVRGKVDPKFMKQLKKIKESISKLVDKTVYLVPDLGRKMISKLLREITCILTDLRECFVKLYNHHFCCTKSNKVTDSG